MATNRTQQDLTEVRLGDAVGLGGEGASGPTPLAISSTPSSRYRLFAGLGRGTAEALVGRAEDWDELTERNLGRTLGRTRSRA